jgi:hypothetical protein
MSKIVENPRKLSPEFLSVMAGDCGVYGNRAGIYESDLSDLGFCAPAGLAKALDKVFWEPKFPFRENEKINILDIGYGTG